MKRCKRAFGWSLRSSARFAQRAVRCDIFGQYTYRCLLAPELALRPMRSFGSRPGPQPSLIFFTIRPMLEPTSMGASSLILPVVAQHIRKEGGFSSPLTSGRFVCTLDIQHTFRGKNLWPIRTNYAQTACARRVERPGVARKGQALLQGIVRCGRCGALLHVHYAGREARIS